MWPDSRRFSASWTDNYNLMKNPIHTSAILIALSAVLAFTPISNATPPPAYIQAMWVFPDAAHANPVTDPSARDELISNSEHSNVDALYLSVYNYPENSAGRRLYDETAIADLIRRAHAKRILVNATYGAPDWLGCSAGSFQQQRMQEVLAYNASHPTARFDGVVLDIEPSDDSDATMQALLASYQCIHDTIAPSGLTLSVAIRFYWDNAVEYPAGSGNVKPVYQHIIDMDLQNVVVMGYRDFAGPQDCSDDGIVCLDKAEVAYAASIGKPSLVLVGLETSNPATTGITPRQTFFEEGQKGMNSTAQTVAYAFGDSFGGFAVHNYQNAYLSGASALWPTKNNGRGLPGK